MQKDGRRIIWKMSIGPGFSLEQHFMWCVIPVDQGVALRLDRVAGSESFGRYDAIPPERDLDRFFEIMELNHPTAAYQHDLAVCAATARQVAGDAFSDQHKDQVHTFNVSMTTLGFNDAAERLIGIMSRHGPPSLFSIEITEPRGPISQEKLRTITRNAHQLAEAGCRLLLDDLMADDVRLIYLAPYVCGFKTDYHTTHRILEQNDLRRVFADKAMAFIRDTCGQRGIVVLEGVGSPTDAINLHQHFAPTNHVLCQGYDLVPDRRQTPRPQQRAANNARFGGLPSLTAAF